MSALPVTRLGDELWGERLKRARDRSKVTLEQAATLVSEVVTVSYGALARLEKLRVAPEDQHRRFVAYLTMLAYGFTPTDLGLGPDAIPPLIDRRRLAKIVSGWKTSSVQSPSAESDLFPHRFEWSVDSQRVLLDRRPKIQVDVFYEMAS